MMWPFTLGHSSCATISAEGETSKLVYARVVSSMKLSFRESSLAFICSYCSAVEASGSSSEFESPAR